MVDVIGRTGSQEAAAAVDEVRRDMEKLRTEFDATPEAALHERKKKWGLVMDRIV
jgi:hypothetical protein